MNEDLLSDCSVFRLKSAILETAAMSQLYSPTVINTHLQLEATTCIRGKKTAFQEILLSALKQAVDGYQTYAQMKLVLVSAQETPRQVQVAITDGGHGFSLWKRLFILADRRLAHASGVGELQMMKQVIEQLLDGKMTMISRRGKGTTLIWVFPKITPI